jgi:hypothetical protein
MSFLPKHFQVEKEKVPLSKKQHFLFQSIICGKLNSFGQGTPPLR